jgi:hypothetical protein
MKKSGKERIYKKTFACFYFGGRSEDEALEPSSNDGKEQNVIKRWV